MARILYIGDYYPMFSFKAKLNAMMAEAIHKKGHEVCDPGNVGLYGGFNLLFFSKVSQRNSFRRQICF